MKKILIAFAALVVILFLLIQFVPVETTNPPVVTQPQWDSPATEQLFRRACADCHSNETVWPLYSRIAPVSWLLERDVRLGREEFNISELGMGEEDDAEELPEEIAEVIQKGEMPLRIYLPLHPEARLSAEEKQALIDGLSRTIPNSLPR